MPILFSAFKSNAKSIAFRGEHSFKKTCIFKQFLTSGTWWRTWLKFTAQIKKEKWTGSNKHLPFWMLISEARWDLTVVGSCWYHIKRELIIQCSEDTDTWSGDIQHGWVCDPARTKQGLQQRQLLPHTALPMGHSNSSAPAAPQPARRTGLSSPECSQQSTHPAPHTCWPSAARVSLRLSATKPSIFIWKKKRTRALCFPFQMWPAQTFYDNRPESELLFRQFSLSSQPEGV